MNALKLRIPAKINLSLDITGKRSDGYHTLRSVFQTVGIFDTLTLTKTDENTPLSLTCDTEGIPCDARNLVWKAAQKLLGDDPCGIAMHLEKHIPSQAGMGGGSADCAAALFGIRKLCGLNVTDAEMLQIAASLGADVPFFLRGGTVLCEGIGEIMTPLAPMPARLLVMAKGEEGVSTPAGYRALDALDTPPAPHTDAVLAHLQDADADTFFAACGNDFDAVTGLAEVQTIRRIMRENGVIPILSGSGAAVFGGCSTPEQAEHLAEELHAAGLSFTEICRTTAEGITEI